jgi:holliday junction DNA helicase RuvA
MFNSLTGTLSGKSGGRVTLAAGPIEWEFEVSFSSLQGLPPVGETARIFTYLHHRDDALKLFGFVREEERAVFLELLKVDGIGPRQAMKILSGTDAERFVGILDAGDVDSLRRIPGIGLKTAQKIILTLKGKLSLKPEEEQPAEGADLVQALVDMGFERRRAGLAVRSLLENYRQDGRDPKKLERELFKEAIVRLSSD